MNSFVPRNVASVCLILTDNNPLVNSSNYDGVLDNMRNLLCVLVGHQPPVYATKGWYSPGEEYGSLVLGCTDGIGRVHGYVEAACARCGTKFIVARTHILNSHRTELFPAPVVQDSRSKSDDCPSDSSK